MTNLTPPKRILVVMDEEKKKRNYFSWHNSDSRKWAHRKLKIKGIAQVTKSSTHSINRCTMYHFLSLARLWNVIFLHNGISYRIPYSQHVFYCHLPKHWTYCGVRTVRQTKTVKNTSWLYSKWHLSRSQMSYLYTMEFCQLFNI